jgi:hypothetical protein
MVWTVQIGPGKAGISGSIFSFWDKMHIKLKQLNFLTIATRVEKDQLRHGQAKESKTITETLL